MSCPKKTAGPKQKHESENTPTAESALAGPASLDQLVGFVRLFQTLYRRTIDDEVTVAELTSIGPSKNSVLYVRQDLKFLP